ncbi:MAG: UDP-N-acetylmuramoyl-L-alanyl-D-glutamate--2,6-diaminopimelate ligase [Kiloniellales bacterium]
MRLTELAEGTTIEMVPEAAMEPVEIRGLAADSRKIAPGYLFAALPGSIADGRSFIDEAVAKGAVAVLGPRGTRLRNYGRPVALLTDDNPRRRLALMAAQFYVRQPRVIAAVTGTNGKTSVADFTRQIWTHCGRKAASLGTLGLVPERPDAPAALTTPDPVELHRCLAALAGDGFDHLAMEASSHGLDQYRLDGVKVTAAAFTNLSRDHLDYHGGMEPYLQAKLRVFRELLLPGGTAVVNADVPEAEAIRAAVADRKVTLLTYGRAGHALRLVERRPTGAGQDLTLDVLGERHELRLPLAGAFQAANVLAALGLTLATGADPGQAVAALTHLKGVRGRLELVARTPSGATVYVDYAHTPDALDNVLTALRPHTKGRLFVVFGCGGDRDRGKRPIMGEAAYRLADVAVATDDNPRSEDPATIRRAVLAAAPGAQEIGDRRAAITETVARLEDGDVLVVAGKGHEQGQIVAGTVLPFDDRSVAQGAVAALEKNR